MPTLVAAGFSFLTGLLGGLLEKLFTFFGSYALKRLVFIGLFIATIVALTTLFTTSIQGLFAGIQTAIPAEVYTAASMVLPSNTGACIAAVVAAHLFRWVYVWNVKFITLKMPT